MPLKGQNLKKKRKIKGLDICRVIVLMLTLAIIATLVVLRDDVEEVTEKFLEWVKQNPLLGPFMLSLAFCVCTVLCIPGSILTIGAGIAFQ